MKVLTHSEMRAADLAAIDGGIPALVLMENAAHALLRAMEQRYSPLSKQRIAIFCGKGNNGGDGLALARLLFVLHRPAQLKVILAYAPEELAPDAARQLQMLEALGIPYTMQLPPDLAATTLAIDALLGTGISGELRSPIAELVSIINSLPLAIRVAVDIPSGGQIDAQLTVTFAAPKLEQVMPPGCDQMGELVVAPIGIPDRFLASAKLNLITLADLKPIGMPRERNSHKGNFGHVAIIGGAKGKPGALQLAGVAAIRGGAGLATVYSPESGFSPDLPDLMRGDWDLMNKELPGRSVVAIGPGLGTSAAMRELVQNLYRYLTTTLVLDADALNNLSPLIEPHLAYFPRILTPHPGEMARLLGRPIENRIEDASQLAVRVNSTIILKGQRTLVALPDGQTWINPTGSPALAKAGSGDVLTGLLAALLSQYPKHPVQATLAAVYLHGRCGELAARHGHEMTSLASNLCDQLPEALHELT